MACQFENKTVPVATQGYRRLGVADAGQKFDYNVPYNDIANAALINSQINFVPLLHMTTHLECNSLDFSIF